jgi:hypothetical protein
MLAVFLGFFITFTAQAYTVLLSVIETGLPDNGSQNQHSVLWENAFLDVFFEAGYIVSNAPILRLEGKPSGDIIRFIDMDEARSAGADYMIVAQLDYTADTPLPLDISLIIYKIDDRKTIIEKQIAERKRNDIKAIARGIVPYIR